MSGTQQRWRSAWRRHVGDATAARRRRGRSVPAGTCSFDRALLRPRRAAGSPTAHGPPPRASRARWPPPSLPPRAARARRPPPYLPQPACGSLAGAGAYAWALSSPAIGGRRGRWRSPIRSLRPTTSATSTKTITVVPPSHVTSNGATSASALSISSPTPPSSEAAPPPPAALAAPMATATASN